LFALLERTNFVPFSKFDFLKLEICPPCAAETDGAAGGNGFFPALAMSPAKFPEPLLDQPVLFQASPTGEPETQEEFDKWDYGCVRGKLGGRQVSIQAPLQASCEHCGSPLTFVASLDEQWAPNHLNFGTGLGYIFACSAECSPESALFYWDCD
jgi:hypothetical protein